MKLKLQYFGHLMRRANSLEKTLILGKMEGRRRGQQRMRWQDGITDSMDVSLSELRGIMAAASARPIPAAQGAQGSAGACGGALSLPGLCPGIWRT